MPVILYSNRRDSSLTAIIIAELGAIAKELPVPRWQPFLPDTLLGTGLRKRVGIDPDVVLAAVMVQEATVSTQVAFQLATIHALFDLSLDDRDDLRSNLARDCGQCFQGIARVGEGFGQILRLRNQLRIER